MTTVRIDDYVGVRCDACGTTSDLILKQPGWRMLLGDHWLWYAVGDVQLCPSCKARVQTLKRESAPRPGDQSPEGPASA